jgi:hypothetical protein
MITSESHSLSPASPFPCQIPSHPTVAQQSLAERFELAYADERGEQRTPLTEAWSAPFESCAPVRGFPSYKGQPHHVGRWWTATTGTLVGYESWLERDRLVLLDFVLSAEILTVTRRVNGHGVGPQPSHHHNHQDHRRQPLTAPPTA